MCWVCVYDSVCEKWRVSHCIWKGWNHDNGIGIGIGIDTDIDIGIFSLGEWQSEDLFVMLLGHFPAPLHDTCSLDTQSVWFSLTNLHCKFSD